MSHTYQQVEAVFNQACEMPPGERRAFIVKACGGDPEFLRDVESLLRELDSDVTGAVAFAVADGLSDTPEHESIPERLGEFRIVRLLGEGGMGRVFEAVQESPSRSVALKIVRAGAFSRSLLTRFRREANVLAQLKHPGIAQVLQVGSFVLADGQSQPYFAMELIHGLCITEHVRVRDLDARARLSLIAKTCDAVQHAHQRGVIHRDLKPANVLVEDASSDDGDGGTSFSHVGQPKVLDFGIARLVTDQTDAAVSMRTEAGQIVGTLGYMSPEQTSGDSRLIDTRADVYALGALAYELLTGRVPVEVAGKPITLAVKLIQDQAPTPLGALVPALRGDAEVIIAKALDKDPDRRYASAGELGADIRRFLRDEPIVARPASMAYTLRKFSRRHRGPLIGVAAAMVAIIGSLTYGFITTRNQRDRAVSAENKAQTRAEQLQKVSDFQSQMLAQVDPTQAGVMLTTDVKARLESALVKSKVSDADRASREEAFAAEWANVNATDAARQLINQTILKPAIEAIDKQFADQPLLDATLRDTLAIRYADLGMYDDAIALLAQCVKIRTRELGEDHADTLFAAKRMANVLRLSRGNVRAESMLREVLERTRAVLGDEHEETLYVMNSLAVVYMSAGRFEEAETLERDVIEKARRVLGEHHEQIPIFTGNLASALQQQGKLQDAEKYMREALDESTRILGAENHLTLQSGSNYAVLLGWMGKYSEAEAAFREAHAKQNRVLGEEHPDTIRSLTHLGALLMQWGRLADAEPLLREGLAGSRRALGNDNMLTLTALGALADLLQRLRNVAEAEPLFQEVIAASRRVLGADHPDTLLHMSNLTVLLLNQDRLSEAEPLAKEVLEGRRRVLGPDHPSTITSLNILASILESQMKLDLAEPYYREALEACRRSLGSSHPDIVVYLNNLGSLMRDQDKLTDAEQLFREAADTSERTLGKDHSTSIYVKSQHAATLTALGRFEESLQILEPMQEPVRAAFGATDPRTVGLLILKLGAARTGLREFEKAEGHLLEAQQLLLARGNPSPRDVRRYTEAFAGLYTAWSAAAPSEALEAKKLEWTGKLAELDKPSTTNPALGQ